MHPRPSLAFLLLVLVLLVRGSDRALAQNFGFQLEYTTGSVSRAVHLADLNGDGKPDLVSANNDANTVSVLLGNGLGAFSKKPDIAFTAPWAVAVGDVNGDGKPDLAVCGGGTIALFLGNGLGGFGARTDFAVPGTAKSVALGDVTGDTRVDLVVAISSSDIVALYPGNGLGGFGARQDDTILAGAQEVALGDLNGDGSLDACVLSTTGPSKVSVLLSDASSGLLPRVDYATGGFALGLALGDVSGDGRVDAVTANSSTNSVSVLLGDGTGALLPKTDYSAPAGPPKRVAIAEVTGDGLPDLCLSVSTFSNGSCGLTVMRALGGGAFTQGGSFAVKLEQSSVLGIAAGDVNGDGRADVALGSSTTSVVSVLLNRGVGEFRTRDDLVANFGKADVAVGDLNKDGRPDLVSYVDFVSSVSVFLAGAAGGFLAKTDYATVSGWPLAAAIGEVTGDTNPDVVVTRSGNVLAVMNGNGSGAVSFGTTYSVGLNPIDVALADMNNDGRLDAVVLNNGDASVSVLLGSGAGFAAKTDYATGANPQRVVIADLNGDGLRDVVASNGNANSVSVFLGTGSGALGAKTDFTVGGSPIGVAVGDVNGDGFLDIATANGGAWNGSILLGTGVGSFGPKADFSVPGPYEIAIGDMNGDGWKDVCTTRGTAPLEVDSLVYFVPGNGAGGFGVNSTTTVAPTPRGLVMTDLNADGRVDVVTANKSSVSVLVGLEPTQTTLTVTPPSSLLLGLPMTLTANVTVPSPGSGAPADSVRFFDGFTLLGTAPVTGGVASLSLNATFLGERALRAYYKGDTRLISSGSSLVMRRVVPTPGVGVGEGDAAGFAFESVLPNPGRAAAMRFAFTLPSAGRVTLEWFDVRGRRVARKDAGSLGAGRHSIPLGDVGLAPGSYLVRLKQGAASATRRVTVLEAP